MNNTLSLVRLIKQSTEIMCQDLNPKKGTEKPKACYMMPKHAKLYIKMGRGRTWLTWLKNLKLLMAVQIIEP